MKKHIYNSIILGIGCFFLAVTIQAQEIIATATEGNLEQVKAQLIENPQLVNVKDASGRTPLHWAARGKHFEVLKFLLENGADANAKDNNSITALASSVSRNHLEAVELLISRGALLNELDNNKEAPLHYAAARGYVEIVEALLKGNTQLDLKNSYGRTPLLLAARESGNFEIVKMLVESGAEIDAIDNNLDTPLSLAAWRGYEDIVDYLLEKNASLPDSGLKAKALFAYSLNKKLWRLYVKLLEQGADINTLGRKGSTLLHVAAKGGSDLIVNDLIDRDLQVNVKDMFSMTPLHYSAKYGRLSVVKVLVENGAEINNRTRLEETPLNLAQKGGFKEVSDYLISKGAKQGLVEYTKLTGEYFGQREPGSKPEIFAPGIITNISNGHSNVTFSPDGSEALWTEWNENESGYPDGCKILYSKIENGFWKIPEIVVKRGDVPIFSVDGTRVYFRATTQQASGQFIDEIQYFESNNIALGSAKTLPFDLTSSGLNWQFSFDKDENIYFASNNRLFKSQNEGGEYLPSEDLSKIYNPEYAGGHPFISKDGDYIIFASRGTQGDGDIDLFIGYRKKDGSWTKPVNLGQEINTSKNEYLPIVSGDGKYLFFVSNREEGDFLRFWVSAKIIEDLKPAELK